MEVYKVIDCVNEPKDSSVLVGKKKKAILRFSNEVLKEAEVKSQI